MTIAQFTFAVAAGVARLAQRPLPLRRCRRADAGLRAPRRLGGLRLILHRHRRSVRVPQRHAQHVRCRRRVRGRAVHAAEGRATATSAPTTCTGIWEKTGEDVVPRLARHHRQRRCSLCARSTRTASAPARTSSPRRLIEVGELPGMRHLRHRRPRPAALHADCQRHAGRHVRRQRLSSASAAMNIPTARTACSSTTRISIRSASPWRPTIATTCAASYGWENYQSQQRSRNASSAAEQLNPLRDWTTDYTGKVNFFEAGFDITRHRADADPDHRRLEPVERYLSLWPGHRFAAGGAGAAAAGQERADRAPRSTSPTIWRATCGSAWPTGSTTTRSRTSRSDQPP